MHYAFGSVSRFVPKLFVLLTWRFRNEKKRLLFFFSSLSLHRFLWREREPDLTVWMEVADWSVTPSQTLTLLSRDTMPLDHVEEKCTRSPRNMLMMSSTAVLEWMSYGRWERKQTFKAFFLIQICYSNCITQAWSGFYHFKTFYIFQSQNVIYWLNHCLNIPKNICKCALQTQMHEKMLFH